MRFSALIRQNIRRIDEGQHEQRKCASGSKRKTTARPADVEKSRDRSAQGGGTEAHHHPQDKEQLGIGNWLIANQQKDRKADHYERGHRRRNTVELEACRACSF
jgi:hypothetical protein